MIGIQVGSYRIVEPIARGGIGTVYLGEHVMIGRPAAIKLLRNEYSANRDLVERLFHEAKVATAINHPGIVEVYDVGYTAAGQAFIVMEMLPGITLGGRLRERGRMSEAEAALLVRGVCSALEAAHAQGVIHRDLKPENVFLVPDPESPIGVRPKLLDFGIAKSAARAQAIGKTMTGSVLGTPAYMSPEQCRGAGEVDHRSDLYAVGCLLYELVTGRPPFAYDGIGEVLGAHLYLDPDPASRWAPISRELDELILALLAKDPAQRTQSAREVSDRLTEIAQRHTPMRLGSPIDLARSFGATQIVSIPAPADDATTDEPDAEETVVVATQKRSSAGPAYPPARSVSLALAGATPVARFARGPHSGPSSPRSEPARRRRWRVLFGFAPAVVIGALASIPGVSDADRPLFDGAAAVMVEAVQRIDESVAPGRSWLVAHEDVSVAPAAISVPDPPDTVPSRRVRGPRIRRSFARQTPPPPEAEPPPLLETDL